MSNSATIWVTSSSVTARIWFIGRFGVENDSKEYAPMPGSIALIELASQVIGAGQADWLANFDV
jgi:hypothetical protein